MERRPFLEAKIIILGASGVGKTSLAVRFCRGVFTKEQDTTIGITHMQQVIPLKGHSIKFLLYDTAGQERFESIASSYFRAADAAVLVYDLTRPDTVARARRWHQELSQQATKPLVLSVVGNKADLVPTDRRKSSEAVALAEEIGALHMHVSASSEENVKALFTWIAEKLNPSLLLESDERPMHKRGLSVRNVHVPEQPTSSGCFNC